MGLCEKPYFLVKYLIAAFLGINLIIFASLSWFPLVLLRCIVQVLAKIFRPDLDEILKPRDAFLGTDYISSNPKFNINIFMFLENDVDIETTQERVQARVFETLITRPRCDFQYERLRQTVETFCGYVFWKTLGHFDIRNYVRLYEDSLEEGDITKYELPIGQEYSEEDLQGISAYLMSKPWRKNCGLWELILLRNYRPSPKPGGATPEKQSVIIFRIHHGLADGYSLNRLMAVIGGYEGNVAAYSPPMKESIMNRIFFRLLIPLKAFLDVTLHLAKRNYDNNDWVKRTGGPSVLNFESTWTEAIPVDRIKNIKQNLGVSFLSVVHGVSSGALRKMMIASDAKVPTTLSCFHALPQPKHRGGLRNHAMAAILDLHTGETDAVKRVLRSHRTLSKEIRSLAPLLLVKGSTLLGLLPNTLAKYAPIPGVTIGMSPFIGMESPPLFTPVNPCRECFFTVGIPEQYRGATVSITTLSHAGKITFAFTVRTGVFKSRKQLNLFKDFVEEEIQLLEKESAVETFEVV